MQTDEQTSKVNRATVSVEDPSTLKVDPEFSDLCPRLSDSERELLASSVRHDGVRDAVVAWNGIVVDGHHRREIAIECGVFLPVSKLEAANRDEVKRWILTNQLGRRNLTRIQAGYLRGTYYRNARLVPGRRTKGILPVCSGDDRQVADIVARMFRVSRCTVQADLVLADAIDSMSPDARRDILCGNVLTFPSYVRQLAAIPMEDQERIARRAASGEKAAIKNGLVEWADAGGKATVMCQSCFHEIPVGSTCVQCAKIREAASERAIEKNGKIGVKLETSRPVREKRARQHETPAALGRDSIHKTETPTQAELDVVRLCHEVLAWLDETPRTSAKEIHFTTLGRLQREIGKWLDDE